MHVIAPAITTTSIILSSSKIQNGRHSGTGIPWLTRKMVVKRVSLLCLVQSYDNYCNLPKKSTTKYQLYFATMLTHLSRNNCTNTYNLLTAVTSLCTKLQNNSILINYYSKFCKRVFFTKFLSDTQRIEHKLYSTRLCLRHLSHYSSVSRHYNVVGIRLHTYMPKCRVCLALVGILLKPPKCS